MSENHRMYRIAWIGDAGLGGGVLGMGRMLLCALADGGRCQIDWYFREGDASAGELGRSVAEGRLKPHPFRYAWDWKAWYGKNPKLSFAMSFLKRMQAHDRMIKALLAEHARNPYDVIIQFSQAELLSLRKHAADLPLILFPCVHAAGELRWTLREDHLAKRCEPALWRFLRKQYFRYRTAVQRRDYRLARGVIGMSRAFNAEVAADYDVSPERMGVVYQPVETRDVPSTGDPAGSERVRLLFVGRISVRKGLDLLLDVLPSMAAEDLQLEFHFVGGGSLWSNYEPLMSGFPRERFVWHRSLPNARVQELMQSSHILLVPSQYEPGGIVVGEAMGNGMIVVASDAVGSAENLFPPVAFRFARGDREQLAMAIREAVRTVRRDGEGLRRQALSAAQKFAPDKMAEMLLGEVNRLVPR